MAPGWSHGLIASWHPMGLSETIDGHWEPYMAHVSFVSQVLYTLDYDLKFVKLYSNFNTNKL